MNSGSMGTLKTKFWKNSRTCMLIGEDDPAAELVAALIAEGECGTVVVSSYLQKLGGGRIVTIRGWSREKHVNECRDFPANSPENSS